MHTVSRWVGLIFPARTRQLTRSAVERKVTSFVASLISNRPLRRATVAGAVALGALILPAAPAMAEPIVVPNIGTFDVPAIPGFPAPVFPGMPGPAAVQSIGERAFEAAQAKLGSPYVFGAAGPSAFDCSGLVQWAYAQAGLSVPRTSGGQAAVGYAVPLSDLQPGDIVSYNGGGHSAIYAGNGNIIHASTSGTPVRYAPLNSMAVYAARRL